MTARAAREPAPERVLSPDPLARAEASAAVPVKTGDQGIDTLAEIVRLLNILSEEERHAALAYLTSRYAGPM